MESTDVDNPERRNHELYASAAYWRGRAEMAEAQAMTGKPVPNAVAHLIHERDELKALVVALWETLGDVQRDGQKKGQPLPTWRVTVAQAAALDAALQAHSEQDRG